MIWERISTATSQPGWQGTLIKYWLKKVKNSGQEMWLEHGYAEKEIWRHLSRKTNGHLKLEKMSHIFLETNGREKLAKNGQKALASTTNITLIGLRGWGSGKKTTPNVNETQNLKGVNAYDDMFIVLTSNGQLGILNNCNFESTDAKGWYKSGDKKYTLTGKYGDIADGTYEIYYGYHKEYEALWVNNNKPVDSKTYNPVNSNYYIYGCHIHKGGDSWTFSTGCITIYQNDWKKFISYFKTNTAITDKKGNYVRDSYGNIKGKLTGTLAGIMVIVSI